MLLCRRCYSRLWRRCRFVLLANDETFIMDGRYRDRSKKTPLPALRFRALMPSGRYASHAGAFHGQPHAGVLLHAGGDA